LATGVIEVDHQHKELFRQVAVLTEAMRQGQGRDALAKTLDFLGAYAIQHFATEERQMAEARCPAAAENRRAHAEFVAKFKSLRERFDEAGATTTLVLEIGNFLGKWLVEHISKVDKQLGACVAKV
jgi:hemerythrin